MASDEHNGEYFDWSTNTWEKYFWQVNDRTSDHVQRVTSFPHVARRMGMQATPPNINQASEILQRAGSQGGRENYTDVSPISGTLTHFDVVEQGGRCGVRVRVESTGGYKKEEYTLWGSPPPVQGRKKFCGIF